MPDNSQVVVHKNMSNKDYHANRTHLSSSKLKLLLESPEQFYQEFVLGNKEPEKEKPYFLVGSYFHTLVLEPDKVEAEYAFWSGWQKRGKDYLEFVEANPGKSILSAAQKNAGEVLARATTANPIATKLLEGGIAEQSMFTMLQDVPIKIRCDKMNTDKGYIIDLKSTSHPTSIDFFRESVAMYGYDLSAALYLMAAEQIFQRPFDFYFVVASKDDACTEVYKLSKATRSRGEALVNKALSLYKQCQTTGIWELPKNANKSANLDEIEEV